MRFINRRQILTMLATLPMVARSDTTTAQSRSSVQSDSSRSGQSSTFEHPSFPTLPDDPLIETDHHLYGALGDGTLPDFWPEVNPAVAKEEILRLDPDIVFPTSFGTGPPPLDIGFMDTDSTIGMFHKRYDMPIGSGEHFNISPGKLYEDWYSDLPEDERWTHLDGSVVEHPEELAGENLDGRRWGSDDDDFDQNPDRDTHVITASIFAEGTLDFFVRNLRDGFKLGATQFWIDGFEILLGGPLDFSPWAEDAFRTHLKSLSDARLAELEIDDPESFDIRDYFDSRGIGPHSGTPPTDPVFREYADFQNLAYKRFIEALFEQSQMDLPEEVADLERVIFGNQFGVQPHILWPQGFYLSDVVDHIQIEIGPTTLPSVLPNRPHPMVVKTGRALGRYEKPVRIYSTFGGYEEENVGQYGLDSAEYYTTLLRFEAAQAYAHGGIGVARLTHRERFDDMLNGWMRPDGSVDDVLHEFIDFVRAHRRFLTEADEFNNAVVLLSLPTIYWDWVSWGELGGQDRTEGVPGCGAALRRAHVPYDVHVLDYPHLWEAPEQTEALPEFDLIVLANAMCISDAQVTALEAALDAGSTVVAVGGEPEYDAAFQPHDEVSTLLEQAENGVVIDDSPSKEGTDSISQAIGDSVPDSARQATLDTDGDVSLNVMRQRDPDRVIVHLLNYEYDPSTDSMTTRTDLQVEIADLPFTTGAASYHTPGSVIDLDVEGTAGGAAVTVPELNIWGFVVFAAENGDLTPDTTAAEASNRIEAAEIAIEEANEEDRLELLEKAEAKLENAQAVQEYDAFGVAETLAAEAIEWARKAYRIPSIGIDAAHGQPGSTDGEVAWSETLATLETQFTDHELVELSEEWTEEAIVEIDVMLLTPTLDEPEHGFTDNELSLVHDFVENGGTLIITGMGGAPADINDVSTMFGIEFENSSITTNEGSISASFEQTGLTPLMMNPKFGRANHSMPIDVTEDGTVYCRISEESNAVVDEGTSERSADGEPIGVAVEYGNGLVIGFGKSTIITHGESPGILDRFVEFAAKQRSEIDAREENEAEKEEDGTEEEEGETDDPGDETIDGEDADGSPGFGVGWALTGLAGTIYLISQRLHERKDDE